MIIINTDRPKLELHNGDTVTIWEYDIVLIKIEIERLTLANPLNADRTPTAAFLLEFAKVLAGMGLIGCGCDVALKMWSLIPVQFNQLSSDINNQLASQVASS